MMQKPLLSLGISALVIVVTAMPAIAAAPMSKKIGAKTYYKVTATDTTLNTGTKVCAAVGKACLGYTNLASNTVCKAFHTDAKSLVSVNGSKAGFYCDGSPQTGFACEKQKNTCEVCPSCNINADCNFAIGGLFREMFVECGAALPKSSSSSSVSSSKKPTTPPPPPVQSGGIGPFPGKIACDFYQAKSKKVTSCKALGVANNFCVIAMQSRFAKAAECNDNGRIVCTKPCVTNPKEMPLTQCAYDPERRSGYTRAPYDFCNGGTATQTFSSSPAAAKKQPGEVCKHGGECVSGICLGVGRPNGQDLYQCSCNQFRMDTTCKK